MNDLETHERASESSETILRLMCVLVRERLKGEGKDEPEGPSGNPEV